MSETHERLIVRALVWLAMFARNTDPRFNGSHADVCRYCGQRHHSTNGYCDFTEFRMRLSR